MFLLFIFTFLSLFYLGQNIRSGTGFFFPVAHSCPSLIKFLIDVDNREGVTQTKGTTEMEVVQQIQQKIQFGFS